MGTLKLEIPEEILQSVKLPPGELQEELRKELALALYQREVLSLGKARQLAAMTRWQFQELLGERKISRHYTDKDFAEDVTYARRDC